MACERGKRCRYAESIARKLGVDEVDEEFEGRAITLPFLFASTQKLG
jgi:hypothetical protein